MQSARAATAALPAVLLWPALPASCVGLVRSDQPVLLPVAAGDAGLALSAPCVSTPVAKLPHYDRGPGRFTGGQACCRLLGLWPPPTDYCSACMPHHHPPLCCLDVSACQSPAPAPPILLFSTGNHYIKCPSIAWMHEWIAIESLRRV